MHGTLKITLHNPLKREYVLSFNTENELNNIISILDTRFQEDKEDEEEDQLMI